MDPDPYARLRGILTKASEMEMVGYPYHPRRAPVSPAHRKIGVTLRCRVASAVKNQATTKASKTEALLGCTVAQLTVHLASLFAPGMTLENHGLWHIDHIRPCSSFDLTDPEEQRRCFHWTNLQPLWAKDNLSKGGKSLPNLIQGRSYETAPSIPPALAVSVKPTLQRGYTEEAPAGRKWIRRSRKFLMAMAGNGHVKA